MRKSRFLVLFLALFAVLLAIWTASGIAAPYAHLVLVLASVVGPMLHGWVLELPAGGLQRPVWVHGAERVELVIQLDAVAAGVVPLIALFLATPGLGWRRRLVLIAIGLVCYFLLQMIIVVLFPLLVFHKNAFTDIIGTFLGLLAFVGGPVIIWFGLTFRHLRRWLPLLRG
jgi:hypothetical protein